MNRNMKHDLLDLAFPVKTVIDFGGAWCTHYTVYAASRGAAVTMVDIQDPRYPEACKEAEKIRFIKRDFSKDNPTGDGPNTAELVVMFDVLLHQYDPLGTLRNLLSCSSDKVCICLPCLGEDVDIPHSSLVFLPSLEPKYQQRFNPGLDHLYVDGFYLPKTFSRGCWLWGMFPELLRCWLEREGFHITEERRGHWGGIWIKWGCVAARGQQ